MTLPTTKNHPGFPGIVSPIWLTVLAAALCFGCQSDKHLTRLGGGYEEREHRDYSFGSSEEPARVSLQYRSAAGKITKIWPALSGAPEVIKGDLAIFVGDQAVLAPEKTIRPRLFAVKAPALPLDITDEVLWRWSQANGKKFMSATECFNLVLPEQKNDRLVLHFEFVTLEGVTVDKDWPDKSDLTLTWPQVAEIMRAVQTKGVRQKDRRWGTPYIGENF